MEIQGSDGSKTRLDLNSTTVFGRENGFHPNDLSVSRRHISLDLSPSPDSQTAPRVSFEVLGKNPVWVYNKHQGNGKIKAFKRFQRGELGADDLFCLSAKNPVWFSLKKGEEVVDERERERERGEIEERVNAELSQSLETCGFKDDGDFGLDFVDIASIDPVQEFGFLVIGHEFDQYPKQMIRKIKHWDWFLEDPRGDIDEEEAPERRGKTGGRRKRKKTRGANDVDEEWTGESVDEELTSEARKVQRPKYHTRSKDNGKQRNYSTNRKSSAKASRRAEEEEYEDEEDETLGGFIVNDENVEEDVEDEVDEDEEEEFVEDEDELED